MHIVKSIHRAIMGTPRPPGDASEAETSHPRRTGPQRETNIHTPLLARRRSDEEAAQTLPPRPRGDAARAALASLRSPRHPAAERAQGPGAELPPTALEVEQWRRAAEEELPTLPRAYQWYEGRQYTSPDHLKKAADAIDTAAILSSPSLAIEFLPAASLPPSIGRLRHLESLSITATACSALPDSIGDLANLNTLVLAGNPHVKRLPDTFMRLDKLTTLHAIGMPLEALPQEIGNLRALTELRLSRGCYAQLPPGFTDLSALKTLEIALAGSKRPDVGGGLQALPHDMGRLCSLETLDLNHQRSLLFLPDSLADLTQLRDLNLAYCGKLTELPYRLGQLHNLQKLTLNNNGGLRKLPESLCDLKHLQHLDLSHCTNLQALPAELGKLEELQTLNLTGCTNLRELPASLRELPAGCEVVVPGHQLPQPR
jgi:hypothetical protein